MSGYSYTTNFKLDKIADNIGIDDVWIGFKADLPISWKNDLAKGRKNYIINTGNKDNGGIHWCALFLDGDDAYYFNSLNNRSRDFDTLEEVSNVFQTLGYNIYINPKQIQSDVSGWCGIFCLYFLWWMNKKGHKKILFQQFNSMWNDNPSKNLPLLKERFKAIGHPYYYMK